MARLFGTDGVRGLANKELTAVMALQLGEAAARILTEGASPTRRPRAVIARDTRVSGEMLSQAMAAGLTSAGVDVEHVNVLPTPGLAYLTASRDVELGVVISASHNPMPDNGIKFFARGGFKLDDGLEDRIEELLGAHWERPVGENVGRVMDVAAQADEDYINHLVRSVGANLEGLHVVLDCANGATSAVAPEAFRRAGAQVSVINADPDGYNINLNCGSTHIESLREAVVRLGGDVGFAFDGDADRCLAVDEHGELVDGDQIMAILALAMKEEGTLPHNTLVVTVMSNLGLHLAMRDAGITLVTTGVGDRYVLEAMREGGYGLGGEQSGHVIALDHATTGDGTLTALLVARQIARTGRSLSTLASVMRRLPQTLINVPGVRKNHVSQCAPLQEAIVAAEKRLGETGRVLLRASGTEPLVRVMVEAPTQEESDAVAASLAEVVARELAL